MQTHGEFIMTLDEIRKELERDTKIDPTALDLESLKIPQLHSKYLNFLLDEKLVFSKCHSDSLIIERCRWEYYTGKMSKEELAEKGWEPFDLKILRQDIPLYLDSDPEVIQARQKVTYQKEKMAILEEIIKELNNRHWKIRCAIDWKKFVSGQ